MRRVSDLKSSAHSQALQMRQYLQSFGVESLSSKRQTSQATRAILWANAHRVAIGEGEGCAAVVEEVGYRRIGAKHSPVPVDHNDEHGLFGEVLIDGVKGWGSSNHDFRERSIRPAPCASPVQIPP